jgi:hypothetical protein
MVEGYLLEEMGDTFCSDFCLDIAYPGSSIEMANMTDEQLEDSTWYWTSWDEDDNEEDEGALQQVSFEDAKSAFADDQRVYLVSQVFYKKATHLDDIIDHYNFEGKFLIRQDYANDFNMGR